MCSLLTVLYAAPLDRCTSTNDGELPAVCGGVSPLFQILDPVDETTKSSQEAPIVSFQDDSQGNVPDNITIATARPLVHNDHARAHDTNLDRLTSLCVEADCCFVAGYCVE